MRLQQAARGPCLSGKQLLAKQQQAIHTRIATQLRRLRRHLQGRVRSQERQRRTEPGRCADFCVCHCVGFYVYHCTGPESAAACSGALLRDRLTVLCVS